MARILVTTQFGLNTTWVHSGGAYATVPVPFVERNGKEDVRGFGPAVSNERVIKRAFKVGIVEVHIRVSVTRRRYVDQSSSRPNERRDPVDQDKVAQVIRAELCFETIGCVAERCGHNSGVGDDHVERLSVC